MEKYNEIGKKLTGESNSKPDHAEFAEIEKIWDLAGSYKYEDEKSVDAGWSNLQARLNTNTPLKVSWLRRNALVVAASIAVLLAAGAGFLLVNKSVDAPVASITEKTGNCQIRKITLTDGSVITLNCNSEITIAPGFNAGNRNIQLNGEATFEVARNENLPFRVMAAGTETRVLGTGFNISAYQGENVKIFVTHGRVQFGNTATKLILTKGQAGLLDKNTSMVISTTADSSALAWQNEVWAFKSTSLTDISAQIKHRYGKTLKFDSKYRNKQFTGKFPANTPVESIVKTITQALKVPITIE